MQCFIPTQPAQESLTSNKSHSATVFLASQPGWWLFSHCKHVVRCLDIQCHATLLSASLATHFWLCTQRKLTVFPQCPILLLGKSVHKELWWELEEMFLSGAPTALCTWIFFCSIEIFVFLLCSMQKQGPSPKGEHRGEILSWELRAEFIRSHLLSPHICLTFQFLFSVTVWFTVFICN